GWQWLHGRRAHWLRGRGSLRCCLWRCRQRRLRWREPVRRNKMCCRREGRLERLGRRLRYRRHLLRHGQRVRRIGLGGLRLCKRWRGQSDSANKRDRGHDTHRSSASCPPARLMTILHILTAAELSLRGELLKNEEFHGIFRAEFLTAGPIMVNAGRLGDSGEL